MIALELQADSRLTPSDCNFIIFLMHPSCFAEGNRLQLVADQLAVLKFINFKGLLHTGVIIVSNYSCVTVVNLESPGHEKMRRITSLPSETHNKVLKGFTLEMFNFGTNSWSKIIRLLFVNSVLVLFSIFA